MENACFNVCTPKNTRHFIYINAKARNNDKKEKGESPSSNNKKLTDSEAPVLPNYNYNSNTLEFHLIDMCHFIF